MEFELDIKAIESCSYAMSTDITKYYIKGVHVFEKDGVINYESTDGIILVRFKSDFKSDQGINIIIPDWVIKDLSKKTFLKNFGVDEFTKIKCKIRGESLEIKMPKGTLTIDLVDGTFPNTDHILNDNAEDNLGVKRIGINPTLIAKLERSINSFGRKHNDLVFNFKGETSKIIVKSRFVDGWQAVVMPLRIS